MASIKPFIIQGVQLFRYGNYEKAHEQFRNATALYQQSDEANSPEGVYVYIDAMRWKGVTEVKLGRYDEAIRTLKQVLDNTNEKPPEVVYYLSLARYYYSFFLDYKTSTLMAALEGLKNIRPMVDMAKVTALKALIHTELWELNEAERLVGTIGHANPLSRLVWAHIFRFRNMFDQALTDIDPIVQAEPYNVDALIEKGLILKGKGLYGDALLTLESAVKVDRYNTLAMLFIAEVLELQKRRKDAIIVYTAIDKVVYSPLVKTKLSGLIIPQVNLQPQYGQLPQRQVQKAPSRTLGKLKLTSWDPKIWVGSTFSVYKVTDLLGEGGNGYVLKGVGPNGEEVAIKVLKVQSGVADDYFDTLVAEANNLTSVSNDPDFVKIYAIYVDRLVLNGILSGNLALYTMSPPMIVMELMKGGTLHDLLEDDAFFYSSRWVKTVYRAVATVARALAHMHSAGYVHMDVKPHNIFLTNKPKHPDQLPTVDFKLGDLGSAVRVGGKVTQLTVEYAPPEVYLGTAKPYLDVFALGMTTYVLLTRKMDRPDVQEMNDAFDCYLKNDAYCVKDKVRLAQEKLRQWDVNVPAEVKPIVKSMLDPDPITRPTAKEVSDVMTKLVA
ncbi:serine/threonine-protein kinase [Stygiolobus caldivivus]|uniref:Protein kinase domain-containing protein n=1 Tax=Stygiolobus caldivivus TaxID=2824673 RepID=A0A8D5ZJ60_9CREN|nr:serine/threonine-protein kinase [Stygiolobus caldivivus]BCU69887.1 hypothetical protein KN1_11840 [Stygiolobus caldivivus]